MCIVIDMNALSLVFGPHKSPEFEPVASWIIYGHGKVVVGGSGYRNELKRCHQYLRLFAELNKVGKVAAINSDAVDARTKEIIGACKKKDFDDPHILALIDVSGCRLLCSVDERSFPYYRLLLSKPPKIYTGIRNRKLLNQKNIADVCLPKCKLSKSRIEEIRAAL